MTARLLGRTHRRPQCWCPRRTGRRGLAGLDEAQDVVPEIGNTVNHDVIDFCNQLWGIGKFGIQGCWPWPPHAIPHSLDS